MTIQEINNIKKKIQRLNNIMCYDMQHSKKKNRDKARQEANRIITNLIETINNTKI